MRAMSAHEAAQSEIALAGKRYHTLPEPSSDGKDIRVLGSLAWAASFPHLTESPSRNPWTARPWTWGRLFSSGSVCRTRPVLLIPPSPRGITQLEKESLECWRLKGVCDGVIFRDGRRKVSRRHISEKGGEDG